MDEKKFLNKEGLEHLINKIKLDDADLLAVAKTHTDEAVSQKTQVQFIIWGEDD